MKLEITPLTNEQLTELKQLKSQNPDYYQHVFDFFQSNVRAYPKYKVYGINTSFSKDIWQLARYFEYQLLKKNCTPL